MGVFFRIGMRVSLSLSGTSYTSPPGEGSPDVVLDSGLGEGTPILLGVAGREAVSAVDFTISFDASLRSGVSDLRAIDAKLNSGIRLRAAFPYVAIFLRGGTLS